VGGLPGSVALMVVASRRMLLVVSKSCAFGPSLVDGGVGSGVAGSDLLVTVVGTGEGRGELFSLGEASRLSFRGG
jgi:hypothetical protein